MEQNSKFGMIELSPNETTTQFLSHLHISYAESLKKNISNHSPNIPLSCSLSLWFSSCQWKDFSRVSKIWQRKVDQTCRPLRLCIGYWKVKIRMGSLQVHGYRDEARVLHNQHTTQNHSNWMASFKVDTILSPTASCSPTLSPWAELAPEHTCQQCLAWERHQCS